MNFVSWIPEPPERSKKLAEHGILHIKPYLDPWAWMNDQAVAVSDRLINVLSEKYGLINAKVCACGTSMGGYSSIIYSVMSSVNTVYCIIDSAPTDLTVFINERGGTARTLFTAMYGCAGNDFDKIIHDRSPVNMIDLLPDIPYRIFHCDKDPLVSVSHAVNFFEKAKKVRDCKLNIVHADTHSELPPEDETLLTDYIIEAFSTDM